MNRVIGFQQQTVASVTTRQIVSVMVASPEDGEQLDLFAAQDWKDQFLEIIKRFHVFYPSDIARLSNSLPPKGCMVGPFFDSLARKKLIAKTGEYRRSPRDTRKGGIEWEYRNLCVN